MPVEPFSYAMLALFVTMLALNVWIYAEPKYDAWQARRQRANTAALMVSRDSFFNFLKVAFILNGTVTSRNENLMVWSRIQTFSVIFQGYPEFLVPSPEHVIVHNYREGNRRKTLHITTQLDHVNRVSNFNVTGMSNQTNAELLHYLQHLPNVLQVQPVTTAVE